MEPEDEAKFRVPIKGMNDDMMELTIRQQELSIQKKISFEEGEWGGYIKDEKKISAAPGGGFMSRQFVEVVKTVRVMLEDRRRKVYIEAVAAFKKPVTAFCHFKEVPVSRNKEDRHSIGCKKKEFIYQFEEAGGSGIGR